MGDVALADAVETPRDFAEVIKLWPTAVELASDVGELEVTVRQWKRRNSIPSDRWLKVIEAARQRGLRMITLDLLAQISAASSPQPAAAE